MKTIIASVSPTRRVCRVERKGKKIYLTVDDVVNMNICGCGPKKRWLCKPYEKLDPYVKYCKFVDF